jgi:ankyrin repeat protein
MDRCLPHTQTIKLLVRSEDAYVSQDTEAPSSFVTVTLLHIAALRGDAAIIRLLCRLSPASVNAVSSDGMTALHYAIAARSALSSIDALLAHGADPAVECGGSRGAAAGGTNAFVLAGCIHSDVLELLRMHAPAARKNIAVTGDDSDNEDAAATSDSKVPCKHSESTVFDAASEGNLAAVSKVLKHGFNVESRNGSGQTLLMVACAWGQRSVAKRVLKQGADMDAVDSAGRTAAHVALQSGKQELCEYLLACGASKDLPDASGVTVAFLLANPEALSSYMQQLQANSASCNLRNSRKMTRQSACFVLQRFALDVAQCHRARCRMQLHGSCASSGREMPRNPWPKTSSYVADRHCRTRAVIVLLQCAWRRRQSRCVSLQLL